MYVYVYLIYSCYRFLLQLRRSEDSLSLLCSLRLLSSLCSLSSVLLDEGRQVVLPASCSLAGCLAASPGSDDRCLCLLAFADRSE